MDLTFSGDFSGHVDQALNVRPVVTGRNYEYEPSRWTTQCAVRPASNGAWTAAVALQVNGITWQIVIENRTYGSPQPGRHKVVRTIGSVDPMDVLGILIISDKSPNGVKTGVGESLAYGYETPWNHRDKEPEVTLDAGLTSGTLDIWLTPSMPAGYAFRITGRWSCAP